MDDFERWLQETVVPIEKSSARPRVLVNAIQYPVEFSREQALLIAAHFELLANQIPTLDEFWSPKEAAMKTKGL